MSHFRYLLFDLDGTLLDSRDPIIDAVYATAEAYVPGLFTREEILARFGESFDDFLDVIDKALGSCYSREQILQYYFKRMDAHHDRTVRLFPGVAEGLQQLKAFGCKLGIVTNKQRDFTMRGLNIAGIFPLFDSIVTLDDVAAGKPSAEPVLRAVAELSADLHETAFIGDSKYDLLAARAAGVAAIFMNWYGMEHGVTVCPDYYFFNFGDLVSELVLEKAK
ncbi:HAD-IA family hydrolase [Aneurinibacillus thermoaerophilus]|uniref:HAD-IA family hydrolase n=1 Tax=Aneurinibacillus thermoaerophilus TaxID=143495 RepID=UPI002E1D6EE8|nr:HAD-IA family hydrolase [Aneurinibacillus thermoaerophilus]MED0738314.1 HAD-IA family hydrolase [Aneurinibacillus thermoaerophilus]